MKTSVLLSILLKIQVPEMLWPLTYTVYINYDDRNY